MRTIEIIVDAHGAIRLETRGFAGAACLDAGRRLKASLGHPLAERLTSEFYASGGDGRRLREVSASTASE